MIGSMIDPKFNFYCTKERSVSTSKDGFKTVTDRFLHCLKKGDYRVTKTNSSIHFSVFTNNSHFRCRQKWALSLPAAR